MSLPPDFQFSQASLQDYVDCPRRFQLRCLLRVDWPAIEAEPALESERHLQQGNAFHRLVHQHMLGIPEERLLDAVADEDLRRWWYNYLTLPPAGLPVTRYPEVVLSAPLGGYRLVAKYDLVAVDAGQRITIIDWKTYRKRPRRKWLGERLQTRVYPYLLVQAGVHLNAGQPLQPEQVEMIYWYANFPGAPERFPYDAAQYEADGDYLASLVEEIEGEVERLGEADFPLTFYERRCNYCPYRSLCRRGAQAGAIEEIEEELDVSDDFDISLDLEQIAEIEY
jgi:CRISPR/Cas system-associated exonuclease Cas4 (RecB family)